MLWWKPRNPYFQDLREKKNFCTNSFQGKKNNQNEGVNNEIYICILFVAIKIYYFDMYKWIEVDSNRVNNSKIMGTGQITKKSEVEVDNGENKNWKGQKEKLKGDKTTRGLKRHSINEKNEDLENHFYSAWTYGQFFF